MNHYLLHLYYKYCSNTIHTYTYYNISGMCVQIK